MIDPIEEELTELGPASINRWAEVCWQVAEQKGFHDPTEIDGIVRETSPVERMMLIVSEVSEMMEAYRARPDMDFTYLEVDGKPEGIPAELADVVIRCLDFARIYKIPLGELMIAKTMFNHTRRTHRHGGKVI